MAGSTNNGVDFSGSVVYAGIDAHMNSWVVNILVDEMEHRTISIDPDASILRNYLEKHFPDAEYRSVYEAGYPGFYPHYNLTKLGINSIVVHPSDIPTADKDKRTKTDGRDCRKLAKNLRAGMLEPIHIPEQDFLELRELIRMRKTMVKQRTRTKNQVKGMVTKLGLGQQMEGINGNWGKKHIGWLKEAEPKTAEGRIALDFLIRDLEHYLLQVKAIDKEIKDLSETEIFRGPVRLLRTVPGIGITSGMTILGEIGDIRRFKNLDRLASYFGIVPGEHSSGGTERKGRMTGRGNKHLKYILIEASWKAVSKDPSLMLAYKRLIVKMPGTKAIVRIARKLLNRIMFVLKNNKEYQILK